MAPYIRGEHSYEVVEGHHGNPTSLKVHRLDRAELGDEEIDAIEEKLRAALPAEAYQTDRALDASGVELSISVRFTVAESKRRNGIDNQVSVVPKAEIQAILPRIPVVLY